MRLDFNKDGNVSIEDVRKSIQSFYEFLKSYDYIEATTRIKSDIYTQARLYIKQRGTADKTVEADEAPISEADNRTAGKDADVAPTAQEQTV